MLFQLVLRKLVHKRNTNAFAKRLTQRSLALQMTPSCCPHKTLQQRASQNAPQVIHKTNHKKRLMTCFMKMLRNSPEKRLTTCLKKTLHNCRRKVFPNLSRVPPPAQLEVLPKLSYLSSQLSCASQDALNSAPSQPPSSSSSSTKSSPALNPRPKKANTRSYRVHPSPPPSPLSNAFHPLPRHLAPLTPQRSSSKLSA